MDWSESDNIQIKPNAELNTPSAGKQVAAAPGHEQASN